jgi:hypothetical protein
MQVLIDFSQKYLGAPVSSFYFSEKWNNRLAAIPDENNQTGILTSGLRTSLSPSQPNWTASGCESL